MRVLHRRLSTLLVLASLLTPAIGMSACGRGAVPGYRDINSVRYVKTSCFGRCPSYEVLFSSLGDYHVGRSYSKRQGTYQSNQTRLKDAVAVLKRHDFYALNIEPVVALDIPHYIIAVERCGVTTKLDMPGLGRRADIDSLFDDLDKIDRQIRWYKTGDNEESPLSGLAQIDP